MCRICRLQEIGGWGVGLSGRWGGLGEAEGEAGPRPGSLGGEGPARGVGDPPGHGQAEADPGRAVRAGGGGPVERLEDPGEVGRRDPAAPVLDGQRDHPRLAPGADLGGLAGRAVVAGVIQQVVQDLRQQRRVGPDPVGAVRRRVVQRGRSGPPRAARRSSCSATQGIRSKSSSGRLAGLGVGPGQEEQGLDDPPEVVGLVADPGQDPAVLLGRAVAAEGDFDLADHRGQRGPELVRGVAGEPPLPLEGLVAAAEQPVEGVGQVLQLVAGRGDREPDEGSSAPGRGRRRPSGQRRQGPPAEPPAHQGGQAPERRSRARPGSGPRSRRVASTGSSRSPADRTSAGRWRGGPTSGRGGAGRLQPAAGDPPGTAPAVDPAGAGPVERVGLAQVGRAVERAPRIVEDRPADLLAAGLLAGDHPTVVGLPLQPARLVLGQRP